MWVARADLTVIDGNVRRQRQAGTTTGSQALLLSRAEPGVRYT